MSELSERRQKRGEGTDRCCPGRCCATGTGRAPAGRSCRAAGSGSSASARLQHNQHPSVLRISTKTRTLTTVAYRKWVEEGRVGVTHRNRDFTLDRSNAQKQGFYFRRERCTETERFYFRWERCTETERFYFRQINLFQFQTSRWTHK